MVEQRVDPDPLFFVPIQPLVACFLTPVSPKRGILGFVKFEGHLPRFGKSTGVTSICAWTLPG